jgi:transposase
MASAYVAAYESMLTGGQWARLAPLFPEPVRSARGRQTPIDNRHCFEVILWMLRYGAAWKASLRENPLASTCWRRPQDWADEDVLEEAWRVLMGELDQRGSLIWEECFAYATFIPARKGGLESVKQSEGRRRSWWRMARA